MHVPFRSLSLFFSLSFVKATNPSEDLGKTFLEYSCIANSAQLTQLLVQ